jgi:hypothetical protein
MSGVIAVCCVCVVFAMTGVHLVHVVRCLIRLRFQQFAGTIAAAMRGVFRRVSRRRVCAMMGMVGAGSVAIYRGRHVMRCAVMRCIVPML